MKQYLLSALAIFSLCIPSLALADDASAQAEAIGKELQEIIKKYRTMELDHYNKTIIRIKDTDGNPRDCAVRIYYNDFKQDSFSTSGGEFSSVFNHGKTFPTQALSIALEDCECKVIKIDKKGPRFPELDERIEKLKKILEDKVGEKITDKISEEAGEAAEKIATKVFEGLGYSSAVTKRFLGGVSFGADLGAPFRDFMMREIDKIFEAVRKQEEQYHKLVGETTPYKPDANKIKEEWSDWAKRTTVGGTYHDAFTEFEFDALVKCPRNFRAPKRSYMFKPLKWLPPITPPVKPKPPVTTGDNNTGSQGTTTTSGGSSSTTSTPSTPAQPPKPLFETETPKETTPQPGDKEDEGVPDCEMCDPILDEIQAKEDDLADAEDDLEDLGDQLENIDGEIENLNNKITQLQSKIYDFDNPSSYIESDGRRVDSTDLEVRRQASLEIWDAYASGQATAQETSIEWENLTPEKIQELKENARARLQAELDGLQQDKKDQEGKKKDLEKDIVAKKQEIEDCKNRIEELKKAYDDCLTRCLAGQEKEIDLAKDYGVVVPSFWDRFFERGQYDPSVQPIFDFTDTGDGDDFIIEHNYELDVSENNTIRVSCNIQQEDCRETTTDEVIEIEYEYDDNESVVGETQPEDNNTALDGETRKYYDERDLILEDVKKDEKSEEKIITRTGSPFDFDREADESEDEYEYDNNENVVPITTDPTEPINALDPDIDDDGVTNTGNTTGYDPAPVTTAPEPRQEPTIVCPDGMFQDMGSCEASNPQGCEVGAQGGGTTCWRAKLTCEDQCGAHGLGVGPADFEPFLESQLDGVSCVSSYEMVIPTANVGACECVPATQPTITFDTTIPTCDTSCGTIACDTSTTCQSGDQTITATCNWNGWTRVGQNQYVPVLGE